jgi:hypothetical protein
MNRARKTALMIPAWLCAVAVAAFPGERAIDTEKPLRRIDMRSRDLPFVSLGITKSIEDIEREDKRQLHHGTQDPHDVAIIESWDDKPKMLFTSPDTLLIYATRTKTDSSRFLQAVFLDPKTAAVKRTMEWPVAIRKRGNDLLDSEARVFPLDDGKFLVHANRKLMLYSRVFHLLAELELTGSSEDFWAVNLPPDSRSFCLRHESNGSVSCEWIEVETLRPAGVTPAGTSFTTWVSTGGVKYYEDGRSESIFASGMRPKDLEIQLRGNRQFFLDAAGFLVTRNGQMEWEEKGTIDSPMSASIVASMGGGRFALTLFDQSGTFASVALKKDIETLVFDVNSRSVVFHFPLKIYWDYESALSPDGRLFAEMHGLQVSIYSLREPTASSKP